MGDTNLESLLVEIRNLDNDIPKLEQMAKDAQSNLNSTRTLRANKTVELTCLLLEQNLIDARHPELEKYVNRTRGELVRT